MNELEDNIYFAFPLQGNNGEKLHGNLNVIEPIITQRNACYAGNDT